MTQPRNPFEHHHDHDHDHDHAEVLTQELDPAQQSLADALRMSFLVLKSAMLLLVLFYLFSGFFSVPSGHVAVRLRFGKIVGEGKERIIQPGKFTPAFPYPIEQVILIPMAMQQIQLDKEFWAKPDPKFTGKTEDEQAEGKPGPLDPEKDGSLLTGDANIIHARWSLSYHVSDPLDYVRNVGQEELAAKLVRAAAEEGVVLAVAQRTADDLIKAQYGREALVAHVQKALDAMHSGLKVEPKLLILSRAIIPMSVRTSYEAVIRAESEKAQQIEQAQQDRTKILGEAAGEAHRQLTELIRRYELATAANDKPTVAAIDAQLDWIFMHLEAPRWVARGEISQESSAALWALLMRIEAAERRGDATAAAAAREQYAAALESLEVPSEWRTNLPISGKVAEAINDANSYRATAVTEVQREAKIFQNWFNVYHGAPAVRRIVEAKLWQEAKAQILTGDIETFYLPPSQTNLVINRDPSVARKRQEEQIKSQELERQSEAIKRASEE